MGTESLITRRKFVGAAGALAGTVTLAPIVVRAQAPPAGKPAEPASTITTPPRDWSPDANPTTYVDPDVITIDPLLTVTGRATRRSSGCGRARSGRKARRGAGKDAISSGVTSRTIGSSAGSKTMGA